MSSATRAGIQRERAFAWCETARELAADGFTQSAQLARVLAGKCMADALWLERRTAA